VVLVILIIIETAVYSSQSFDYYGTVMGLVAAGLISGAIGSYILQTYSNEGEPPKFHKIDERHTKLANTVPTNVRALPAHLDNHLEAEHIFGGYGVNFGEIMLILLASFIIMLWDTDHLYGEVTAIFPLLTSSYIMIVGALVMLMPTSINFTLCCIANCIALLILVCVNSTDPSTIILITVLVAAPFYWLECVLYSWWSYENTKTNSKSK